MTNKTIGKYGEQLAKNFLTQNKFEILETNFRYSKYAEIDIIAKKDNIIHFVEVKTRTQTNFGSPLEAVSRTKLLSIYKCANYYISTIKKQNVSFQIDAIGIVLTNNNPQIEFIENISL